MSVSLRNAAQCVQCKKLRNVTVFGDMGNQFSTSRPCKCGSTACESVVVVKSPGSTRIIGAKKV